MNRYSATAVVLLALLIGTCSNMPARSYESYQNAIMLESTVPAERLIGSVKERLVYRGHQVTEEKLGNVVELTSNWSPKGDPAWDAISAGWKGSNPIEMIVNTIGLSLAIPFLSQRQAMIVVDIEQIGPERMKLWAYARVQTSASMTRSGHVRSMGPGTPIYDNYLTLLKDAVTRAEQASQ